MFKRGSSMLKDLGILYKQTGMPKLSLVNLSPLFVNCVKNDTQCARRFNLLESLNLTGGV